LEKNGEYEIYVHKSKHITLTQWKDTKSFIIISNYTGYPEKENQFSYLRKGENNEREIPPSAFVYRGKMIFVDQADKNRAEHSCQRKTKRWQMSPFGALMDVVFMNCWQYWKQKNPQLKEHQKTQKIFRLKLATQLLGNGIREKKYVDKSRSVLDDGTVLDHDMMVTGPEANAKNCKCESVRCNNVKTKYQCIFCNIPIAKSHQLPHFLAKHNNPQNKFSNT